MTGELLDDLAAQCANVFANMRAVVEAAGGGMDDNQAQPAYGHTPGHSMFVVESKGEKLLLWGDIVHVAAVQFGDPTVTIAYDVDRVEAEQEHWRVFDDAAKNRYMIGGAHLPFPGLGHVRNNGDKTYAFVPLN
jgi:glyoxylase-like metal-dependent hydrolase (beta-lactamase superfamily II)